MKILELAKKAVHEPSKENTQAFNAELQGMTPVEVLTHAPSYAIVPDIDTQILHRAAMLIDDIAIVDKCIDEYPKYMENVEKDPYASEYTEPYRAVLSSTLKVLESRPLLEMYTSKLTEDYLAVSENAVMESVGGSVHSKEQVEIMFALEYCTFALEDLSNEQLLESLHNMNTLAYKYSFFDQEETVMEAFERIRKKAKDADVKGAAKKAGDATVSAAKKVTPDNIEKGIDKVGSATDKGVRKIPHMIQVLADNTVGRLKKMDKDAQRRAMMDGNFTKKVFRLLRMVLTAGAAFALAGPLIGSIITGLALMVRAVTSGQRDARVRDELITDLEQELRVTKEKIRDADSQGDRQAKYQLMRLENAIEKDIQRLKTHQEDKLTRATDREVLN